MPPSQTNGSSERDTVAAAPLAAPENVNVIDRPSPAPVLTSVAVMVQVVPASARLHCQPMSSVPSLLDRPSAKAPTVVPLSALPVNATITAGEKVAQGRHRAAARDCR